MLVHTDGTTAAFCRWSIVWPELTRPGRQQRPCVRPTDGGRAHLKGRGDGREVRARVVVLDGRRTIDAPGSRVEVVRGSRPVKWVRLDDSPFTDRLVTKFELPVTGWRGRSGVRPLA